MKKHLQYFLATMALNVLWTTEIWAQAETVYRSPLNLAFDFVFENLLLLICGIVILVAVGSLLKLNFDLIELQEIAVRGPVEEPTPEPEVEKQSLWKKLSEKAWRLVPMEKEHTIQLGHAFDGIRELDNKLPPWWLGVFYGSILFAGVYLYVYHWSSLDWSSEKEYEMAMEKAAVEVEEYLARNAAPIDETNVVMLTDETALQVGEAIFLNNCATCHGDDGRGTVGPNLCDPYWLHGGGVQNIFKTIKYGVPEKGMIAWKEQLRPETMQQVASFIWSLQGTTPANPKKAEGVLFTAVESVSDSSQVVDESKASL